MKLGDLIKREEELVSQWVTQQEKRPPKTYDHELLIRIVEELAKNRIELLKIRSDLKWLTTLLSLAIGAFVGYIWFKQ
jgi:hypothetical protein